MKRAALALALVASALVAGCGGGAETETVIQERTVTEPAPREGESPPRTPQQPRERSEPSEAGGAITVPDVVGENHQLAQDTMQAAGLYGLDEEDATGQDRLLLYDRNWVVERQEPAAGSEVGPDTTVTLYSKKEGE